MSVNRYNPETGKLERIAGGTVYADAPIGAIQAYGGAEAPRGWLLCDGSAVSRTVYSELFAKIGTAFGPGDGSTTFNVPDLRGTAPAGIYIIKAENIAVPHDFAEYVANQNVLSDYESITIPTTAATAITMPYDGVLNLTCGANSNPMRSIYVNGVIISQPNGGGRSSDAIFFNKGDRIYVILVNSVMELAYVRYYKLRDYSNR